MALTLSGTNGVVGAGFSITPGGAVAGVVTVVTGPVTVGAAVTISESGIEASGIGITCANINGAQIGGRRNILINGDMQVAQRATSITASGSYGIDRWWLAHNGTTTMARDTTVPSGEGFDYSFKLSNISGGDAAIGQPIELITAGKQGGLASGKKITFSFYAKCDSGTDGITVICNFRQGKYTSTNQVGFTNSGAGVTLTTTWTRHVVTMTIPTCHSGSTMAAFELNGISGISYFTGFQAEIGDQATPFEHRSYQEELHLCKRYYQQYPEGPTADNYNCVPSAIMACNNTTTAYYCPTLNPTMRSSPSFSTSGNFRMNGTSSVNNVAVTAIGVYHNGASTPFQYASVASGLTAGQSVALSVNNDATAYIAYNSEL